MWTLYVDNYQKEIGILVIKKKKKSAQRAFGPFGSLSSTVSFRSRFISEMQVANLPPGLISSSCPFSHSLSFSKPGSAREVVVDLR